MNNEVKQLYFFAVLSLVIIAFLILISFHKENSINNEEQNIKTYR